MEEKAHRVVKVLKLLGNPLRYEICRLLSNEGPLVVTEIVQELGENQNTVSQHLSKLRDLDLVYYEREGSYLHYDIDREDIVEAILELEDKLSR